MIDELMKNGLLELILERKKSTPIPQLLEKKIIKNGSGDFAVTLTKEWLAQYGLHFGDTIILFLDREIGEIVLLPYSTKIETFLDEHGIDFIEKKIQKFGTARGGALYLPKKWRNKLDLAKGEKAMFLSDWRGGISPWDAEKVRGYHEKMAEGML